MEVGAPSGDFSVLTVIDRFAGLRTICASCRRNVALRTRLLLFGLPGIPFCMSGVDVLGKSRFLGMGVAEKRMLPGDGDIDRLGDGGFREIGVLRE